MELSDLPHSKFPTTSPPHLLNPIPTIHPPQLRKPTTYTPNLSPEAIQPFPKGVQVHECGVQELGGAAVGQEDKSFIFSTIIIYKVGR